MLAAFGGALVMFIVFVSFAVTSSMSYFIKIMEGKMMVNKFLLWTPDLVHIVITLCAIVVMVLLLLFAEFTPKKHRLRGKNFMRRWLDVNLKLIGLVLFFIAFVFLDVMGIAADYACMDSVFYYCKDPDVKAFRALEICYRIVRIMHALVAVSFCYQLRNRHFVRRDASLIGLAMMQSATLGLWVDFLINESLLVSQSASNSTQALYANACALRIDEWDDHANESYKCVTMKSEMYQFLQDGSPYLFPCSIEFLMLFAECIAAWFFSSVPRGHGRNHRGHNESASVDDERASIMNEERSIDADVTSHDERTDVREMQEEPHGSTEGNPGNVTDADELHDVSFLHCLYKFPWFALASLLIIVGNIIYISMGIAAFFSEHDSKHYNNVFSGYRIGYWMVLTGSTVAGVFLTKRFVTQSPRTASSRLEVQTTKPTGFEYFVTACIFGQSIYLAFTMTANIGTDDEVSPTKFYLAEEVLNLIEVIAQTVFYFFAKGVPAGMKIESPQERQTRRFLLKKKAFETILILFAVSNLALWIEDSFVETRNIDKTFQKKFYDEWPFIYDVVNPMMLLYRFNSILLFTELYLKKPKKPQSITNRPLPG